MWWRFSLSTFGSYVGTKGRESKPRGYWLLVPANSGLMSRSAQGRGCSSSSSSGPAQCSGT
eukprot:9980197-Alexandrium_andersonii.AAC.1